MREVRSIETRRPDQLAEAAELVGSDRLFVQGPDGAMMSMPASRMAEYIAGELAGLRGAKGDPGGNAMAVGLFTALGTIAIPVGTDLIQTSGHTVQGVGPARYRAVGAGPATAWRGQTLNGRWFELAEPQVLASQVGALGYAHADAVRPDVEIVPTVLHEPDYDPTAATLAATPEDEALQAWVDCAADLNLTAWLDAGRAFRQSAPVVVPDGVTIDAAGATLATTAEIDQLRLGSGVRLSGVRLVGPGAAFLGDSRGVVCWGEANGADEAPTRKIGATIDDVEIRGVGGQAVDFRYVSGGLIRRSFLHGLGYAGLLVLSGDDVWMEFCQVERLTGEDYSGELNAYGAAWTRDGSSDVVRYPPSRRGGARFNRLRFIPTWHALDTHGGDGIEFSNNETFNCRRGIVLTSSPQTPPVNCKVRFNVCRNGHGVDERNSNGTEKREAAFWEIGLSDAQRARNNEWTGNIAIGHGMVTQAIGAVFLANCAEMKWGVYGRNIDLGSYSLGVFLSDHLQGRFCHSTIDVRTPGVAGGGFSDAPYALRVDGDDLDMDWIDVRTELENPATDTFVADIGVVWLAGTDRSIRRQGAAQRFDGQFAGFYLASGPGYVGLTGDMTQALSLTAGGFDGDPAVTLRATRLGATVTLALNAAVSGTSDATIFTLGTLPADLRPKAEQRMSVPVEDAGAIGWGRVRVASDGVVSVLNGVAGDGVWTASGAKGVEPFVFTYPLEQDA